MRKLVYITLGFAAACGLWVYVQDWKDWVIGVALILLFGALAGSDARPLARMILVLTGLCAGIFWCRKFDAWYLRIPKAIDQVVCDAEIRACDFANKTDYGSCVDGSIILEERSYQVRVYLNETQEITPGDYLYGSFRFRLTTPDAADGNVYYQSKGIFLLAYQADEVTVVDYPPTRRDIPARIRDKIRRMLDTSLPGVASAFAKALLIGDTSSLDYRTDTNLKISGIRHVAAVSGLHVSIIFALLSMLTLRKRYLMAIIGFPMLLLFAAVAGFSPSVNRACIMSGLMLLAMLVNKEYDGPTALSVSVLIVLFFNPLQITSVSLQLSVSSVTGMYLFMPRLYKWMESCFGECRKKSMKSFIVRWFCASVSVSLSAMVLTTPLCAYYFGMVSLVGPLTNLLTLGLVELIFYGLIVVCGVFVFSPAVASVLGKMISFPISCVLALSDVMADTPLAAVYTVNQYIAAWLIFVYIMLIWFFFSSNRRAVELSCCALLGLCVALLAGWMESAFSDVRFTVLDVGQGQCLIFQTEGKSYMIDCGGDSDSQAADSAAEYLLSQGITKLDGLIITHLDSDHCGGAEKLLTRIDTELLILPPVENTLKSLPNAPVVYAQEQLQLTVGLTKIQVYPPLFPGNSNEMSLCILFDTKNCDILVTGDRNGFGERSLLRHADIPDVDVLVAGHHGSKNSTCEELLAATRPEIVCISVGKDNSYGHPAEEVLKRLQMFGCTIYRTDQQGTITIRR